VDVSAWLKSLDLVECALVFKDNAIGVDVIADLTAEDLREIGVSAVGHRRKILAAAQRLAQLRSGDTAPPSRTCPTFRCSG
jgi:hypothetical protein